MTGPRPDASQRRRAVALAGHHGNEPGAEGVARAGLSDAEPAVRATALGALSRLGALGLDDLTRAAADGAPLVRARAAELAGGFGPAAVGLLVDLLDDDQPSVVEAACFGLGETGEGPAGASGNPAGASDNPAGASDNPAGADEAAVAALSAVAGGHADPLCREAAVAALGAIGSDRGLPAILAATGDKPAVRRRAVTALAAFEGPEVDAALEAALADRDWQVRQAAEDLTGRGATS